MGQAPKRLRPELSPRHRLGAELRRWRQLRGLSQADLAGAAYVSPDLLSKIEKAERWPTTETVEQWDKILDAGGTLSQLWSEVETYRQRQAAKPIPVDPDHWLRMLAVLTAAADVTNTPGLAVVVAEEIGIIDRYRQTAHGPTRAELGRVKNRWLEFANRVSDNRPQPPRADR